MKTLKDIQAAYKEAFALKQENYWVEKIIDEITDQIYNFAKTGKSWGYINLHGANATYMDEVMAALEKMGFTTKEVSWTSFKVWFPTK